MVYITRHNTNNARGYFHPMKKKKGSQDEGRWSFDSLGGMSGLLGYLHDNHSNPPAVFGSYYLKPNPKIGNHTGVVLDLVV